MLTILRKLTLGLVVCGLSLGWIASATSFGADQPTKLNSPAQAPVAAAVNGTAGTNGKTPGVNAGSKNDAKQTVNVGKNQPKQATNVGKNQPKPVNK